MKGKYQIWKSRLHDYWLLRYPDRSIHKGISSFTAAVALMNEHAARELNSQSGKQGLHGHGAQARRDRVADLSPA